MVASSRARAPILAFPDANAMKAAAERSIRLDFASRLEMLETVQTVAGHLTSLLGFDEEAAHCVNVALRESVVNAIKHGNSGDETKRVSVEFLIHARALEVRVQDEGQGFDPDTVPDPRSTENLLKVNGRGIFFMRSFMDEVSYSFPARGGTMVRMLKRVSPG